MLEANPELMDTPDEVRAVLALLARTPRLRWSTQEIPSRVCVDPHCCRSWCRGASNEPCFHAGCQGTDDQLSSPAPLEGRGVCLAEACLHLLLAVPCLKK